jgi:Tol biopolymer transport system component
MSLAVGTRLGTYAVTAKLGEGGMGQVWKAKDFRLGREVALKVLPEGFTSDPDRLARFEREAKLLAQLNHPNIAQIYGLEVQGETRALVMELVEGPTLAERLESGPLPFGESLSLALQIAHALEEAHEKGIVHRDLKPQNIKASLDGRIKVLDFGLAKAMDPLASASGGSGSASQLAQSPTMTVGATMQGVILGTAAYMSPEQAKGFPVDKRADIWAFGVVLHEMLTGARLFSGDSVTETLAEVLKRDVDAAELPPRTPPAIRRLLRRCLERNPRNRLHDIGDARLVIEDVLVGRADAALAVPPPAATAAPRSVRPLVAALASGLVVGALATSLVMRGGAGETSAAPDPPSFRQLTLEPGGERTPSLSPDGQSVAFVKDVDGQSDVFVQRVDGKKAINLTADCPNDDLDPAFSPDGLSIAYASACRGGGLFVMGATGESARRVSERGFAPSWSPDGREIAVVDSRSDLPWAIAGAGPISAVEVETGARREVTRHRALDPAWSPDGRRIAFWSMKGETYQRDLFTVAADGSQAEPDEVVPVVDDPWIDAYPTWSPAGDALWFVSSRTGAFNLWRIAVDPGSGAARGEPEPFTVPSGWAGWPTISRDGRRVVFADRNARTTVMRAAFDPAAGQLTTAPEPTFQGSFEVFDQSISPDGEWVLFSNAGLPANLHLIRTDGTGYRQLIEGRFRDRQGHWSPDGRTIAFQTSRYKGGLALVGVDGSGLREIPLPGVDPIWEPRWSRDGRRLTVNGNESILVVDLGQSPPAVEEQPLPEPGAIFTPAAWLADGERIFGSVFVQGRWNRYSIYSILQKTYRTIAIDSRRPDHNSEQIGDIYATLFPDGSAALIPALGRLLRMPIDGGRTTEVLRIAPAHRIQRPSLSADGRLLTYLDVGDESDLWLAELEPGGGGERAR